MKRFFGLVVVGVFVGAADCGGPAAAPTFTTLRTDIFEPRCGNAAGCHTSSNPPNDLDLITDAYGSLVDKASVVDPSKKLVVAGDPDNSLLMAILKEGASGPGGTVSSMPPGFSLSQDDLDAIEAWIADGAKDN